MLYTIVSPAEIFSEPPCDMQEYKIPCGSVICRKNGKSTQVERLISTDPFDYLKPCYFPGAPYSEPWKVQ